MLATQGFEEIFGRNGFKAQIQRCGMDVIVIGDDVVRARGVSEVEYPPIFRVSQARPIQASRMVHKTHRTYVEGNLKGPHGAAHLLLNVRIAQDSHGFRELVVAYRQPDLSGRYGVKYCGIGSFRSPDNAGHHDHRIQDYQRRAQRLRLYPRTSLCTLNKGASPRE
jgi:hypothetical protein